MEFVEEWKNNYGCIIRKTKKGLYRQFCASCGASEYDAKKIFETGSYSRKVTILCKCGKKYFYVD